MANYPYDDPDYGYDEPCPHEFYEVDVEGRAHCDSCGHKWWATKADSEQLRLANEAYDEHCRREERRARIEYWVGRLAFWRRWFKPKPSPIVDDIPF